MKNPYQTLSSKIDYQNQHFQVRKDQIIHPSGKPGEYYVIELPPPVFIIPMTGEKEIYLVGQFRYTTSIYSWEPPAGGSEGQDLLEAAKRELLEEASLIAHRWKEVGTFQISNGICNQIGHTFLAQELSESKNPAIHDEEISQIKKVPFHEVMQMIKKGQISDADSIASIIQAAIYLKLL